MCKNYTSGSTTDDLGFDASTAVPDPIQWIGKDQFFAYFPVPIRFRFFHLNRYKTLIFFPLIINPVTLCNVPVSSTLMCISYLIILTGLFGQTVLRELQQQPPTNLHNWCLFVLSHTQIKRNKQQRGMGGEGFPAFLYRWAIWFHQGSSIFVRGGGEDSDPIYWP